jgi:ferrous iron transport protein A
MLTLNDVTKNILVKIKEIRAHDDLSCRLQELGFLPGTFVELVNKLPFDGPLAVNVQGAKIALRLEDATRIVIEPAS